MTKQRCDRILVEISCCAATADPFITIIRRVRKLRTSTINLCTEVNGRIVVEQMLVLDLAFKEYHTDACHIKEKFRFINGINGVVTVYEL